MSYTNKPEGFVSHIEAPAPEWAGEGVAGRGLHQKVEGSSHAYFFVYRIHGWRMGRILKSVRGGIY